MDKAPILYLLPTPYKQISISRHCNHGSDYENQNPCYGTNDRASDWLVHQQRVRTFCRLAGDDKVRYLTVIGQLAMRPDLPRFHKALLTLRPRRRSAKSWLVCRSVSSETAADSPFTSFSVSKGHRCCCEGRTSGFQNYLGKKCHRLREVATLEQACGLD